MSEKRAIVIIAGEAAGESLALRAVLEAAGFRTVVAANAAEAGELRAKEPALLLFLHAAPGALPPGTLHDLRQPLSSIYFNAGLLRRDASLDASARERVGRILSACEALDAIVASLGDRSLRREPPSSGGRAGPGA